MTSMLQYFFLELSDMLIEVISFLKELICPFNRKPGRHDKLELAKISIHHRHFVL